MLFDGPPYLTGTPASRAGSGLRAGSFEKNLAVTDSVSDDDYVFALHLFPTLAEWLGLLRRLRVPAGHAARLASLARRNGTALQDELLLSGLVAAADYCDALAAEAGIGHVRSIEPQNLIAPDEVLAGFLRSPSWFRPLKYAESDGFTSFLLVAEALSPPRLKRLTASHPNIRSRMRLVTAATLRAALMLRLRDRQTAQAVSGLFERYAGLSARTVMNGGQGLFLGMMIVAVPLGILIAPMNWVALHAVATAFFIACVALRVAAFLSSRPRRRTTVARGPPSELPLYSVLVALYREAEVVPELVAALRRIDWPASKIEIKLVCEEDDAPTLDAIAAVSLPPNFEVVRVPVSTPRTKPKALSYCLPLTRGAFVVIFDAEDHPHPQQLLQAWQKFSRSSPDLACVQAPLEIVHGAGGFFARMFAFEYAGLFRGLLPWLSANRMLLPLGGTSNHFRRDILDEIGGWDPYNVTEDADLGVRLARFGYRTETIDAPTLESAPENFATWLPQRTRWFKGWLQTWLVHMREPRLLLRELGPGSFVVFQIVCAGMVLSALAHPFLFLSGIAIALELILAGSIGNLRAALLAVDVVTICCGYASFILLGWRNLRFREKFGVWRLMLFTPLYWMLMSLAAWRAVWQLWRKPHLWEKTPHRPIGNSGRIFRRNGF